MSHSKILLRALPNVEFVHGYPGIPASPDRPQATIKGAIEVRLGNQAVKAKWVRVELRKVETIPSGNHGEEFIDFVGQSPITIWQAQDEHETLSSKDFPFSIRVPENLPPSVALEKGAGIKYEVVATLCTKGKKGLFRREASTTVSHSVPVVIDKHELHSTWPVYAQPESRHVVSDGLTLAVDRANTCFAPADRLSVMATLKSDNLSPVVLRGFEFSLRETVIYRAGPQAHGKKSGPQVHTSILGEQKVPVSMTLYGGTQQKAELACLVPGNHTTSSVNSGRHIDIGYTLNIKALLDKAKPIMMDLPVTITNWPRHVSADMTRRIGTAPNLSLTPVARPGIPPAAQYSDLRTGQSYGPPRPPPVGGLPSVPNGRPHHAVPPGALISGPPGSPILSHVINAANVHSPGSQQNPYSMPGQRPPSSASQNPFVIPENISQRPAGSTHPGGAIDEKAALAAKDDVSASNSQGGADEFGYNRQSTVIPATTPSRQSEKYDFGAHDMNQRPASMANHRTSTAQSMGNDVGIGGTNPRMSQYAQDADVRASVISTSSTGRRPRAGSRPLKIVNANDDIPEEESPVKVAASNPFEDPQAQQAAGPSASVPISAASLTQPWPTSDEEKQRLYEKAKAKAERVQARAKASAAAGSSSQTHSPSTSNGHVSPPRQASPTSLEQSNNGERPRTVSPTPSKTPWPTAEDEKQRLFERAQAQARQTQGLAQTPPTTNGTSARSSHHRAASVNSSQDSHTNPALSPYVAASPPTLSAGAALYSHAMASMSRPGSSVISNTPPVHSSAPRRTASHSGSVSNAPPASKAPPVSNAPPASKAPPVSNAPSTTKQHPTAEEEKAALRYLEARKAVERRQKEDGSIPQSIPQEDPIAYEALFPPEISTAASSSASGEGAKSPKLSEKEILRRAYEARDAAAATNQPPPPTPALLTISTQIPPRTMTPPAGPSGPLSEKEILRRAFEARDAAMIRSGQPPQLARSPTQPPPPPPPPPPLVQSPSWTGGPSSSNIEMKPKSPLSEKEQMKLAFEARDRALAAQQIPSPPDYDMPPPGSPGPGLSPPSWNDSSGGPILTAAEEKAQLKARYAQEDAGPGPPTGALTGDLSPGPQAEEVERPAPPAQEYSFRSDSSETFLRRDPTISAGKKRASQMITPPPPSPPPPPPPLPPRPPAEYIEETKLEDRRNIMPPAVTLPPDFSTSFDFGFGSFGEEKEAGSTPPVLPELSSS